MDLLGIASMLTAVTLVLLTCFLIPALLEMRKTAIAVRTLAESADAQLKPLLGEVREAVAEIRMITSTTAANAEGVGQLMEELGHVGENIRALNRVVGAVSTVVAGSSAWVTGARVAGRYLVDTLKRKRG